MKSGAEYIMAYHLGVTGMIISFFEHLLRRLTHSGSKDSLLEVKGKRIVY